MVGPPSRRCSDHPRGLDGEHVHRGLAELSVMGILGLEPGQFGSMAHRWQPEPVQMIARRQRVSSTACRTGLADIRSPPRVAEWGSRPLRRNPAVNFDPELASARGRMDRPGRYEIRVGDDLTGAAKAIIPWLSGGEVLRIGW